MVRRLKAKRVLELQGSGAQSNGELRWPVVRENWIKFCPPCGRSPPLPLSWSSARLGVAFAPPDIRASYARG